jgi:exoribonuclease R
MPSIYWQYALFGSHGKQEAPLDFSLRDGDVYEDDEVFGNVCGREIPGVLMLKMGRTYGKAKSGKRLLYGFTPADRNLPMFLVPYSDGNKQFSKARSDKYAIMRFSKCGANRPEGVLTNTLGNVGDFQAYDEYLLHRYSLYYSLAPFKKAVRGLSEEEDVVSAGALRVFAIDPPGCRDYDDAFSIEGCSVGGYKVRVCIADVCYHLDKIDAWDYLGGQLQTVYLASRPRNMLPPVLSDNLISLVESKTRHCVVFEFIVDLAGKCKFVGVERQICIVEQNYAYDTKVLFASSEYKSLSLATTLAAGTNMDSHDVVAWWMVRLNIECGKILASERTGVFRECSVIVDKRETVLTKLGLARIAEWESRYTLWHNDVKHEALECGPYAQASSPIRRLCDVVNQCLLLALAGHTSGGGEAFCRRVMCAPEIARMTEYSRGASRAERESRVSKFLNDAAVDTVELEACCVHVQGKNHKGIARYRLYIEEIGCIVTQSSTLDYSVGDNVHVRVTCVDGVFMYC